MDRGAAPLSTSFSLYICVVYQYRTQIRGLVETYSKMAGKKTMALKINQIRVCGKGEP
jgi:hypothetical protein